MKRLGMAVGIAMLAAGLALGCAREADDGASRVRHSALATLPRESVALLVLEVKSLRGLPAFTAWAKDFQEQAAKEEGPYRELSRKLGTDVLAKIDRLGLAIVPLSGEHLGYGLMAEGSFDEAALRGALGGQEIFTFVEMEGKPDFSATVLRGGPLVFGPKEVLAKVRGIAAGREAGLGSNGEMLDLLARVGGDAQIWGGLDYRSVAALARASGETGGLESTLQDNPIAHSIRTVAFQGHFGKGASIDLIGRSDGEENAKAIRDAVRGLVAFGRMSAGRDHAKEWQEFLDGITIAQTGHDVTLHALLSDKVMGEIAGNMRALSQGTPMGGVQPPVAGGAAPAPPAEEKPHTGAAPPVGTAPAPPPGAAVPPQPPGSAPPRP
jgi:hypothetical protein